MSFPILQKYLARLSDAHGAASSIWLDHEGKAQGRFFNCTMSSAFQPIRDLDSGAVRAYEGLARSVSAQDQGLSLWKLLDHAASDDESVALDRLCRMLHAMNFFRQAGAAQADLYLNVHDRLLSAVSSNHGHAFRRILDALELPLARVVLQLPAATPQQGWLLNYVSDNYRRNGFRFAVNLHSARDGLAVLDRLRPDVFKLDVRELQDREGLLALLRRSAAARVAVVFRRLETPQHLAAVRELGAAAGVSLLVQGYVLDEPRSVLLEEPARRAA
ncbi:EAL domain-containing protein (putative c-di-GMP-specific phosphodiesterase class I) [Duganella sp. 1224]|uniref:EAL domain-containing protein n=1 Tax=Duganella sp. 1224 TaxID=2587052 RepID=UPI0015C820E1|nr:EAL domain-containing protein [Duganella sp. 1224]NYE59714.1 EAL domain-containing protein (putative c-di-GMP-specific phosphodiesterase class I) [Duganella sp. 1224]